MAEQAVDEPAAASSSAGVSQGLLLQYKPTVEEILSSSGSTSIVGRLKAGVVLKSPRFSWWERSTAAEEEGEGVHDIVKHIRRSFVVEEQILEILGPHPNLIR